MEKNQKEMIKKMFLEDNMSVEEIASKLGFSKVFVKENLLMMGIEPSLSPDLIKKLVKNSKTKASEGVISKRTPKNKSGSIVATRLEIVKLLLEKGTSEKEIYEIFSDMPSDVIDLYIQYLKKHNIYVVSDSSSTAKEDKREITSDSVFGKRPEIIERRKSVYRLYGNKTQPEIARELGITLVTVENDIAFLRKNGIITIESEQEKKKTRRAQIIELYGILSVKQLAEKFGVSEDTIKEDISELEKNKQLNTKNVKERDRRRKAIPELRKKLYISEIANMFGVSTWTINQDIKWLKEHGLLDEKTEIRGRRSREKNKEIADRRKKVAELYGKKSLDEIASILNISMSTIRKRY